MGILDGRLRGREGQMDGGERRKKKAGKVPSTRATGNMVLLAQMQEGATPLHEVFYGQSCFTDAICCEHCSGLENISPSSKEVNHPAFLEQEGKVTRKERRVLEPTYYPSL
jgi:hypothetical protein